jgi:hypothetical protein
MRLASSISCLDLLLGVEQGHLADLLEIAIDRVSCGACSHNLPAPRGSHLRQGLMPSGSIHLRIWELVSGSTQAQGWAFPARSHPGR